MGGDVLDRTVLIGALGCLWESREAYTSNSSTPEQDARFGRLRALLESDPEWHDGEIVVSG